MKKIAYLILIASEVVGCTGIVQSGKSNEFVLKSDKSNIIIKSEKEAYGYRQIIIDSPDSSQRIGVTYDSANTITSIVLYKNGKRMHVIEYFKNGRPKGLVNLDFSTFTGDANYYYENGNKKADGQLVNCKRKGIWRQYDENGKIIKIDTL